MNLRSDNNAGLCPEARAGLLAAAEGDAVGYGDDRFTAAAIESIRALFGADTAVFFVATGTAANTLAIASLTEPWQRVLCHRESHWYEDESTAPERLTLCRSTPISPGPHDPSRIGPADLAPLLGRGRGVHHPAPGVLTLTNSSEFGTVYGPARTAELAQLAHAHDYRVHVDGARFANAVAHLMQSGLSAGAACRALTVDAGVDALSLGGTKAGLAFGEAILLFPQVSAAAARAAERLPFLRKSSGHLLSKHRFVAGPFAHALADDAWLRHATHANAMAERLARGLLARGLEPAFPREANAVFVALAPALEAHLRARGHSFYPFDTPLGPCARLMCSFATTPDEVDEFLADLEVAHSLSS